MKDIIFPLLEWKLLEECSAVLGNCYSDTPKVGSVI